MKYEKNKNYQKFVNEILDDVIMESDKVLSYQFFENNAQFTFETTSGKIDFYPTSDKINFRNKDGWQVDGLKLLKGFCGTNKSYIYIIQGTKDLIIYGCFKEEIKANKYILNSQNMAVRKMELI